MELPPHPAQGGQMKNREQLEYQDKFGKWWPEGSLVPWNEIVAVRRVINFTAQEFRAFAIAQNKRMGIVYRRPRKAGKERK